MSPIKTTVFDRITTDTLKISSVNEYSDDEIRAEFAKLAELAISSKNTPQSPSFYSPLIDVKVRRAHSKADKEKIFLREHKRLEKRAKSLREKIERDRKRDEEEYQRLANKLGYARKGLRRAGY